MPCTKDDREPTGSVVVWNPPKKESGLLDLEPLAKRNLQVGLQSWLSSPEGSEREVHGRVAPPAAFTFKLLICPLI